MPARRGRCVAPSVATVGRRRGPTNRRRGPRAGHPPRFLDPSTVRVAFTSPSLTLATSDGSAAVRDGDHRALACPLSSLATREGLTLPALVRNTTGTSGTGFP